MTETGPDYLDQASIALQRVLMDRPIAFHPALAKAAGSLGAGVLLSQLLYWTGKSKDGWVYRTQAELEEETSMSRWEQATARKNLAAAGLLTEEKRGLPARLYYKVNITALTSLLAGPISPTDSQPRMLQHHILASDGDSISPTESAAYRGNVETNVETNNPTLIPPISPKLLPEEYPAWAEGFSRIEGLSSQTLADLVRVGRLPVTEPDIGCVLAFADWWNRQSGKRKSVVATWRNWLKNEHRILPFSDKPSKDRPWDKSGVGPPLQAGKVRATPENW